MALAAPVTSALAMSVVPTPKARQPSAPLCGVCARNFQQKQSCYQPSIRQPGYVPARGVAIARPGNQDFSLLFLEHALANGVMPLNLGRREFRRGVPLEILN
jgi:hypothetical protein